MNKNLQSPTKLTEFAPLQSEEKAQSVSQFISSLFKINKGSSPDLNEHLKDVNHENLPEWVAESSIESYAEGAEQLSNVYTVDINEGRSLPNVLKRISNLLALKRTNLQEYGDTELKQYWMPDSKSKECYECCEKFTTFRRRHHCRVCGQIFCSQCCNQQIPGKIFGCTGDLRVCTYCCKIVLSYLQSSDLCADLTADLKSLQENLETKLLGNSLPRVLKDNGGQTVDAPLAVQSDGLKRSESVRYQEEKFASGSSSVSYLTSEEKYKALQNSTSLRALFEEILKPTTGITFSMHRFRLRTYYDCFLGSELVDWLIFQQKAKSRVQASAVCQALLEGGYVKPVPELGEPALFVDGYALYKKGELLTSNVPRPKANEVPAQEEPSWVQQIPNDSCNTDSDNEQTSSTELPINKKMLTSSSSYTLDLNVGASSVYLSRPSEVSHQMEQSEVLKRDHEEVAVIRPSEQGDNAPESGWFNASLSTLREVNGEKTAFELLSKAYEQHEQAVLKQLLVSEGLSWQTWTKVIVPLIHGIIATIRPDKNHDAADLDIRHYVQFKILPGGLISDTTLVSGIVCSKNVAHKSMITDIENPKILLLQCSIMYQRTEGRLMSIEPVLMQENEYLRHVAARIVALRPDIVLVQRNVSRVAQDLLREHKITLVHNVKQIVLERLARCTQADLVTSVDAHIGRPKLGTCKRFYLKTFTTDKMETKKTLMFFEGLPSSHLGGTVLLRGRNKSELSQIKKVASFTLFMAYNWRLEKSLLMDEFATPPVANYEFLEESKSSEFVLEKSKPPKEKHPLREVKKPAGVEPVEDFTDPLHSYSLNSEEKISDDLSLAVEDLPLSNDFKKILNDAVLCVSPFVRFHVPYLETESGKKCKLRRFFPKEIYFSRQFEVRNEKNRRDGLDNGKELIGKGEESAKINPLHPFLNAKITDSLESNNIQNFLADFRAKGCRYKKKDSIYNPIDGRQKKKAEMENKDVLDMSNHQRLAVLFCSFSAESNNAPAFCVNPWVVPMYFYGQNDIPLGCFLERYCFRSSYVCPSKTCDTPMVKHIRRFVHDSGCISIQLNFFESDFSEEHVVTWTWCTKCESVSPVVPVSADTWSYSFAKYLELKFHGDAFTRRGEFPCCHSLNHDHYQYFAYKEYVASFKYTKVNIWEISLPPSLIEMSFDVKVYQERLIDDVRVTSQKGHEIFSSIQDRLSCMQNLEDSDIVSNLKQVLAKEQALFKQKVEELQLKLTSPSIEYRAFDEKEVSSGYYKIADALTKVKKSLVESVESWNQRLLDVSRKKDSNDKRKDVKSQQADFENNIEEITYSDINLLNDEKDNQSNYLSGKRIKSFDKESDGSSNSSPKCHQRSQSDGTVISQADDLTDGKKESDKKTVKNILSQLLPTSTALASIPHPFGTSEHYCLPMGQGTSPQIIVYENEPSSIIAYALSSNDYKRAFEELIRRPLNSEPNPSPTTKRKNAGDKDKTDDDKSSSGLLAFLRTKDSKTDLFINSVNTDTLTDVGQSEGVVPEKIDDVKKSRNAHLEVQFQDSGCNFFCRIYLAEQFSAFRSTVLPMGEEAYIRSLSRSVQWNARGGKSGSNFAKTSDDRFILKDMSKSEVPLFLESAQNYFAYMKKCSATKQPTLLGKIVGIYQIIFKNSVNVYRSHLLVMENLFYKGKVNQKFDLKGSMRNRLVVPDNQEGEIVLLDENLLKMTCDSPLYILPHSKAVLTAAIQNDTEFLSAQSVMDYSLLVGLDSENNELVLGIIDYIRTFTWDKRLETIVKKSGILGGHGKLPTIISPEDYQKRFIEAMHKYFLEVPDHWSGLGKGLEANATF